MKTPGTHKLMDDRYNKGFSLVEPEESPTRFRFEGVPQRAQCEEDSVQTPVSGESNEAGKSKRHRFFVLACMVLILIAVFVLAGGFLGKGTPGLQPDPNVKIGSLTGAGADLDKIAEEAQVSFSINAEPEFETGSAPGNLTIENLEINNNRFTVTINLVEDGREVYRSGYLDPGQYIDYASLHAVLPQGDYPAVATIETYRLSDGTPIGRVGAELVLHVKG